ncbi:chain-length determining protein [Rheinheimera baltica]|uniref:Chain-length determining protein n=1 Tax=Rheinheimera baltica TaxID=67576 RepID=A0ABT9HVV5_9GAMM|nr:chain-length determining protein [Rheinheimera baltica]MDP5134955.1 chain-length determining protein [Rheinheimera baltica]MDP5149794.1 chain-length determining protein [Rheinheimera baltica]
MKHLIKLQPHWFAACFAVAVAACYWLFFASDRYVSEATVVLESPEITPTSLNFTALISGTGGAGDLLLLREHLLSVDMLSKLDNALDLRAHYSGNSIDFISRLDSDASTEKFHEYFLNYANIQFDEYSSVLRLRIQAYTPQMAKQITMALMQEGERHMNLMGQRLAQEQLDFIDVQVATLSERLVSAREALLGFQNEHGLVSPTGTVQSIVTIVAQLEAQLAITEAQRKAALKFQSVNAADVVRLDGQIQAYKQQIILEKNKVATGSGLALNRVAAEYETLELRARFALELYSNALMVLENTRVEAARKLKQISVLQQPTLPEYSVEPQRLKSIIVFSFFAFVLAGIAHLARLIIRDHQD